MFPLPLHIYFELTALIACIFFWRSLRTSRLRWFLPFLCFICLVEISGRYLSREMHKPNAWLYNLSIPVEYLFYCFFFLVHYKNKANQYIGSAFLILFTVFVLINILFIQGFYLFNTNFLIVGSFFMVVLSSLSLIEVYFDNSEGIIWQKPLFWISTGVLLFNAGEFSYNLLSRYFITSNIDSTIKLFRVINHKLNLILYFNIIVAFLCQKIIGQSRKD